MPLVEGHVEWGVEQDCSCAFLEMRTQNRREAPTKHPQNSSGPHRSTPTEPNRAASHNIDDLIWTNACAEVHE
eukprot:CAMPEP_0194530952 /NCGR_PEP_ID=MMETSP0253-20130528/68101_1 /TAXON_ID=2966 /ORGANISM="Noctiluca scintillans" /LENGTH=72 /DNA_ID=CAMNT_0039376255 /DNA_START=98 /DNA_END=316 /DNA_ORIENTATION=-